MSTAADAIARIVRERGPVPFPAVFGALTDGQNVTGDCLLTLPHSDRVLWSGVSETVALAVNEAHMSREVHMSPVSMAACLWEGWPLLDDPAWIPTVWHVGPGPCDDCPEWAQD